MLEEAASAQDETSVEGCIGCHSPNGAVPVSNVNHPGDAHYVDLDPRGPASPSGYRQLNVAVSSVDVTGSTVVVDFAVTDADGQEVDNIFDSDGRIILARLVDGVDPTDVNTAGEPVSWTRLVSESFTTAGGSFDFLGSGAYRYTTVFDPMSVPIAAGDTLRAAIQISAGDIPAGNGWCDFDAAAVGANDCDTPPSLTRDIVQTSTCNGCHGVTSDTKLAFHRDGGRTEVELCVTCHNPGLGEADLTNLIHKIHFGEELTQDFRDGEFAHVAFTKDTDNCTVCHQGTGVDVDSWKMKPTRTACGSCHDDVNFDTGENHDGGNQQPTNRFCRNCHPPSGAITLSLFPVATVHQGEARAARAGRYRGPGNGFSIDEINYDRTAETVTVRFSVTREGQKLNLQTDEEFVNGGSLDLKLGWSTDDYTNEGSGSTPAPAQPPSFSLLDIGGTVTDLGNGDYQTVVDVADYGFGTLTAMIDGRPATQVIPGGPYERIPVRSAFAHVSLEPRQPAMARRQVIDIDKCNACHDGSGAGLSLHGNNRVSEMQVCVVCHNVDATDISRRPADPAMALDGKREEAIDMKRMIHQIHAGVDLVEGIVVYGFGNTPHDFSEVDFIGNSRNCLTCHLPGTYGADAAWRTLPTTVDTGVDVTDPADDLNISQTTSVCSSCHDTDRAKDHMLLFGATFASLDADIAIAQVPEPGPLALSLAALATLAAIAHRRTSQATRTGSTFRTPE